MSLMPRACHLPDRGPAGTLIGRRVRGVGPWGRGSRPALGGLRGATGVRRLRPPPGSLARARTGRRV
eukprot:1043424-Pleurochrysis_carterae.AAC.1